MLFFENIYHWINCQRGDKSVYHSGSVFYDGNWGLSYHWVLDEDWKSLQARGFRPWLSQANILNATYSLYICPYYN